MLHLCLIGLFSLGGGFDAAQAQSAVAAGEGALSEGLPGAPADKVKYATDATDEMRQAVKAVTKLVESERKSGDPEKLSCLSNRLTAIRALTQVSESAATRLQEALDVDNDTERADTELRKIVIALGKTRQLVLEADRCLSDSAQRSGETLVRWEGGVLAEEDDTSAIELDTPDIGGDAPSVSPFY